MVMEVWKPLPVLCKMRVADHLRAYLLAGWSELDVQLPRSWAPLRLTGIVKPEDAHALALEWDSFRYIALTATLQKWYLRCVLVVVDMHLDTIPRGPKTNYRPSAGLPGSRSARTGGARVQVAEFRNGHQVNRSGQEFTKQGQNHRSEPEVGGCDHGA